MGKPWFGAKTYGFGLSPKSAEGWLALVVYLAALLALWLAGAAFHLAPWMVGAAVIALTIGLIVLVVVKSDHQPWKWRWGGE